jgi:hypothetical protein
MVLPAAAAADTAPAASAAVAPGLAATCTKLTKACAATARTCSWFAPLPSTCTYVSCWGPAYLCQASCQDMCLDCWCKGVGEQAAA